MHIEQHHSPPSSISPSTHNRDAQTPIFDEDVSRFKPAIPTDTHMQNRTRASMCGTIAHSGDTNYRVTPAHLTTVTTRIQPLDGPYPSQTDDFRFAPEYSNTRGTGHRSHPKRTAISTNRSSEASTGHLTHVWKFVRPQQHEPVPACSVLSMSGRECHLLNSILQCDFEEERSENVVIVGSVW